LRLLLHLLLVHHHLLLLLTVCHHLLRWSIIWILTVAIILHPHWIVIILWWLAKLLLLLLHLHVRLLSCVIRTRLDDPSAQFSLYVDLNLIREHVDDRVQALFLLYVQALMVVFDDQVEQLSVVLLHFLALEIVLFQLGLSRDN
jgi:hypothetical protein